MYFILNNLIMSQHLLLLVHSFVDLFVTELLFFVSLLDLGQEFDF